MINWRTVFFFKTSSMRKTRASMANSILASQTIIPAITETGFKLPEIFIWFYVTENILYISEWKWNVESRGHNEVRVRSMQRPHHLCSHRLVWGHDSELAWLNGTLWSPWCFLLCWFYTTFNTFGKEIKKQNKQLHLFIICLSNELF